MLKQIILWFFGFLIVIVIAAGTYLYMMDWNAHKAMVESRLSQISGLNARIDGNLSVKLLPAPQISADLVKFYKPSDRSKALVSVNRISADLDLWKLLKKNFVLKSMTLTQMDVNVTINEKGDLNWKGVGGTNINKSGNIEVSFENVRINNATLSYNDLKEKKQFQLGNISASVNAPSLKGPYHAKGQLIYGNSEITFSGNIVKDSQLNVNLNIENPSTMSKLAIDGTLGSNSRGTLNFDTKNLQKILAVVLGNDNISSYYGEPMFLAFKYSGEGDTFKLDNFNISFGRDTKGVGSIILNKNKEQQGFQASFDMTQFNLSVLQSILTDMLVAVKSNKDFDASKYAGLSGDVNLKSGNVVYNGVAANNLNIGFTFKNNALSLDRFGLDMPGESSVKLVGKATLDKTLSYQFSPSVKTNDLRVLASIFNIDLAKLASANNKKNIFKRAGADMKLSGDLDNVKISVLDAFFDTTNAKGNIGIIDKGEQKFVIADMQFSKILFDKYIEALPQNLRDASFKDKLIHQFNLIKLDKNINLEAYVDIESAVYNQVPLEKVALEFKSNQDALEIKKLSIDNMASATLNLSFNATNIYDNPKFNELSYDIRSSNLPQLTNALGIDTGKYGLFKRKIFASQGALSGTIDQFSVSSVQKFGDTEFSYTGIVANKNQEISVDGDLELKTNNFSSFVKALDFDYNPDLPVTTFALNGELKGSVHNFMLDKIVSHLGANAINGQFQFDDSDKKPKLVVNLDFDKFDADRLFNLSKKSFITSKSGSNHNFIEKPLFNDEKIDYSPLKKLDFKIQSKAKQFVFDNKVYTNAKLDVLLKDGILTVVSFNTERMASHIDFYFMLNTNNIPSIDGEYNLKSIDVSRLGGFVYALEGGQLFAEGTFKSSAVSLKDFFENIDSRGKIQLVSPVFIGWDLDIIKFDFEQRKSTEGFESSVMHNLSSGRSVFANISGKYDIVKGHVMAENILWKSPVANINMNFDLNWADWLFNADFAVAYLNASFSDILRFTFSDNMADPKLSLNIKDSIARISEAESTIKAAKEREKRVQQDKLSGRINSMQNEADALLKDCSHIILDVVRFKPVTNNASIQNVYTDNVKQIQETEKKLTDIIAVLKNEPDEKVLEAMEAELISIRTKLNIIPKSLEDNFVADGKYIYEDIFNKIAWVYNVAQNNSSYYESVSTAYMDQIHLLEDSVTPVDEEKKMQLASDVKDIIKIMDSIKALHNQIRESYFDVIDATKISEMRENNEISTTCLKNILAYTNKMDNKIIESIDDFRTVLDISARDYDQYMVYPPHDIADIDIKKPTTPLPQKVEDSLSPEPDAENVPPADDEKANEETKTDLPQQDSDDDKKKEKLTSFLDSFSKNFSQFFSTELNSKGLSSVGLSKYVKTSEPDVKDRQIPSEEPSSSETVISSGVIADNNQVSSAEVNEEKALVVANIDQQPSTVVNEPEEVSCKVDTKQDVSQANDKLPSVDIKTSDRIDETVDNTNLVVTVNNSATDDNVQKTSDENIGIAQSSPLSVSDTNDFAEQLLADNTPVFSSIADTIHSEIQGANIDVALEIKVPSTHEDTIIVADENLNDVIPQKNAKSSLKSNPVIAMEIGKDADLPTAKNSEISIKAHKFGFKKAQKTVKLQLADETGDALETVPSPMLTTKENNKKSSQSQKVAQNITKKALHNVIRVANPHEKSLPSPTNFSKDATVAVSMAEEDNSFRYIYSAKSDIIPFFGDVGKQLYVSKKESQHTAPVINKYVFAAQTTLLPLFSGQITKNSSLYVK